MSGILFCKTRDLDGMVAFYRDRIGMTPWLAQADCVILKHGNFLLGLHQQPEVDTAGLLTFFYETRAEVDAMHARIESRTRGAPVENPKYRIYHFYAEDPEGRALEFQSFDHPLEPYKDGEELLRSRRSIRSFTNRPVEDPLLARVLEGCVLAPSSKNSQPCAFVIVRDRDRLERLAAVRGDSSLPIAAAPMAVAITSDPALTGRPVEDACIAAYHFLLAAWTHGLGTCWIGGMDRDEVKEILGIPRDRTVATVTPLGYPAETPTPRPRRPARILG